LPGCVVWNDVQIAEFDERTVRTDAHSPEQEMGAQQQTTMADDKLI
jgi:hypothetical protein